MSTRRRSDSKPAGRRPNRIIGAAAFPALRAFLGGYLHQDFIFEHGTPEMALQAFVNEASPRERQLLAREVEQFLSVTRDSSWLDLRRDFADLGAAWAPANRPVLERFLGQISNRR